MRYNVNIPAVHFQAEIRRDPTIDERFPIAVFIDGDHHNSFLDREQAMDYITEVARMISNGEKVQIKRTR